MTGTLALARFALRRDRGKLAAWVGGITLMVVYVTTAIPAVYATEDDLADIVRMLADPIGRMLVGPGYGFDDPTHASVIANGYGLWFMVLAALMNIFLVVRHTRAEEASGRAELVLAQAVDRRAPLTATMLVAVVANGAVAALTTMVMVGNGGFAIAGSLLTGLSVGTVGLAFAGVTTVAVQLSSYTRGASGMAGAVLGAAFALRATGDMAREGGSALSWASPLGWAQQSAPFVLDRWWPLVPLLFLAAGSMMLGFFLSARRDLAASFLAVRPGPARARPGLGTPVGLAFRLQRANIVGWTVALVLTGGIYGAYADAMGDTVDDLPEVFADLFGEDDLIAGYLAYIAAFSAYLMGAYVIGAIGGMRIDENEGRGEPILATPVSRWRWLGANVAVTAGAVLVMSVLVGAAGGIAAAAVTGHSAHVGEVLAAQLNQVPAVLVVLAVVVLVYAAVPRAFPVTWAVVGYGLFIGTFGPVIGVPQVVLDLSPYEHPAAVPVDAFSAVPVILLLVVAAALGVVGFTMFRRRDLQPL